MPTFQIELGNGAKYEVEAPDERMAATGLFEELYRTWSPDDLEMYKIKNRDGFSDFIIDKRAAPKDGETQAEYEKRRYGGRNTEGAAWARSNPVAAGAATLLQGVPFAGEWSDEALGNVASVLYGGDAEQYTNVVRGGREQFAVNNPKSATGLQIGGAIAGTLPALAVAPWSAAPASSSLAARILGGAALGTVGGAAEGAVSGYGAGTDSASRSQMAADRSITGAALGGVLGGALPAVGSALRNTAAPISDFFTTRRPMRDMGLDRPSYEILERATAADEALAGPGAVNIARGGPGAMIADAGPSTANLLDAALQKSGPSVGVGRRRVEQRAAGAFNNVTNALDSTLGPYQGVATAERVSRETTAGARSAAYNAAYNKRIKFGTPNTRTLQALLRRVPQSAIDKANDLMRLEGYRNQVVGGFIDSNGRFKLKYQPSVRQIDYITRGLNQVAEAGEDAGKLGGRTDVSRALSNLARDIRLQARNIIPEYGVALDTAATPIQSRNAMRLGEAFKNMTRSEFAEELRGMTAAEIRSVRSGVRAQLDEAIALTRRAMTDVNMDARQAATALRELSSPAAREKISMILDPQDAARLFAQLDEASSAIELRANLAQNSKTMARQDMADTVRAVNEGTLASSLRRGETGGLLKRLWQAASGGRPIDDQMREDEIYSQIVEFLTGPRGPDAQRRLQLLRDVAANGPAGQALANRIANDIAAIGAVGTYTAGVDARERAQSEKRRAQGLLDQ